MSFLFSNSAFEPGACLNSYVPAGTSADQRNNREPTDRAIDTALRGVPLPDGLLTRLGKLAHSLPDESADQVDWLGC